MDYPDCSESITTQRSDQGGTSLAFAVFHLGHVAQPGIRVQHVSSPESSWSIIVVSTGLSHCLDWRHDDGIDHCLSGYHAVLGVSFVDVFGLVHAVAAVAQLGSLSARSLALQATLGSNGIQVCGLLVGKGVQ